MITQKAVEKLKPQEKPYFLRSTSIKGFAVKVNPSGTIRDVVETKHNGKSLRKTVGTHPMMPLKGAEQEALKSLKQVHIGYVEPKSLRTILKEYLETVKLKPNTQRNYKEVIENYLQDWLKLPLRNINKLMIEQRFVTIRDKF